MESSDIRYILTRAISVIALIVGMLLAWSFFKKHQRRSEIIRELQSITSDSSFFQQFYAEDAKKDLIRAVGYIAELNALGIPPDKAINRGMGVRTPLFGNDLESKETDPKHHIIRTCLRGNYENFLKLGYTADFQTLDSMRNGELARLPSGPHQGKRAIVTCLIDPSLSPGLDKTIANLVIRPPAPKTELTDIEVAAAKKLATNLYYAGVIERDVRDRIHNALTPPSETTEENPAKQPLKQPAPTPAGKPAPAAP